MTRDLGRWQSIKIICLSVVYPGVYHSVLSDFISIPFIEDFSREVFR